MAQEEEQGSRANEGSDTDGERRRGPQCTGSGSLMGQGDCDGDNGDGFRGHGEFEGDRSDGSRGHGEGEGEGERREGSRGPGEGSLWEPLLHLRAGFGALWPSGMSRISC